MLTNSISLKQFHAVLSGLMLVASASFFFVFTYCMYLNTGIMLSIDVFYSRFYRYSVYLRLTPYSLLFSCLVSFITGIVFIYSYSYMAFYTNYKFFLLTTLGFVLSILVVINFTDLFMVILGWDGLGVISFFLIVYYNSGNTVYSGVFTMLMNRVGDALLVLSISLLCLTSPLHTSFETFSSTSGCLLISLILGFMTKSALFPFSPWLPAAISAPTPISSLVHSSTLVTAGLYLIVRFSGFMYRIPNVMVLLTIVSVFTTFYAGLNSLVEQDLKKLIALSTLSHLGFIGLAISSGFESLAIFHLFTHALFKSLIFMSLGEIIRAQSHYQDSRFLSSGMAVTPESSSFIYISTLSLFGLPFASGFYSKDMILESVLFSNSLGLVLTVAVYLNLIFTYCYTSRILTFCTSTSKHTPYFNLSKPHPHTPHLLLLGVTGLLFGYMYLVTCLDSSPLPVVPRLRILPSLLMFSVVSISLLTLRGASSPAPILTGTSGGMLFLTNLNSNFFSMGSISSAKFLTKTVEHGILSSTSIGFPHLSIVTQSKVFWVFLKSPLYMVLLSVALSIVSMLVLNIF